MKPTPPPSGFAVRPGAAERWIDGRAPASRDAGRDAASAFIARLTIDVTPAMRRRLKLAAVEQGTTVADLMRALIHRHFPETEEARP